MQFKRILCAVDFTPSARDALTVATELARGGASLDVCHVVDRHRLAAEVGEIPGGERLMEELVVNAERELETWRHAAAAIAPSASACSVNGRPWEEVVDLAGRLAADLIVVGPGGRQPDLLGSTAERIVRHAPCSVLVTAGGARLPRRILCAIDFSTTSRDASAVAARLATERDADLAVVHAFSFAEFELPLVAGPPSWSSGVTGWSPPRSSMAGRPMPSWPPRAPAISTGSWPDRTVAPASFERSSVP
jgi:nucleotide-binding universal stress UspA family protein